MPLTTLQLSATVTSAMNKTLLGFTGPATPNNTLSFNLLNISLSAWNQVFEQVYTLFAVAPSGLTATLASGGSLTASQAYYYEVTAVGYAGFNTTNETSGSGDATATTSSGSQTINLSWTALPGALSYNVYRNTVNNFASGQGAVLIGNTTGTTLSDNGTASTTSQVPPASMPNDYVEFDLSSFTTLAGETATPGHLLGLFVTNTGVIGSSQLTLAPGSANGLSGIFTGTTPALTLRINGLSIPVCGPPTGDTGIAISGSSKTLRVTNGGSQATTVQICAITGP